MKTLHLSAPLLALMQWYYGWSVPKLGLGNLLLFVWDLAIDFWKQIVGTVIASYFIVGLVRWYYVANDNIHHFTYTPFLDIWWIGFL